MGHSTITNLPDASVGGTSVRLRGITGPSELEFTTGSVVRWDHAEQSWVKATAISITTAEALGVVELQSPCDSEANTITYDVVFGGEVKGMSSLIPGEVYFLSPSIAGRTTTNQPSGIGSVIKAIFIAKTSTIAIVTNYIGYTYDADCKVNTDTIIPVGTIKPYARKQGSTYIGDLSGWLPCDGASYLTGEFPDLFGAIGYTFGNNDGQFRVPNMGERTLLGDTSIGVHNASDMPSGTNIKTGSDYTDSVYNTQKYAYVRFIIRSTTTSLADI